MTNNKYVISLYDYTGEALIPWAEAGYRCYAYDIQHTGREHKLFDSGGFIVFCKIDLHDKENINRLLKAYKNKDVVFAMAFPVCTDLAVSGAAHFQRKRERDPLFQRKAANYAMWCSKLFEALNVPYFVENPVSVLSTLWRKPDQSFHPYQYGGYIPSNQSVHPKWPDYIAPYDAYPKKTCLWTGNNFVMPDKLPVKPQDGYSTQHLKLGGKSQKTKNIRSATPRGFARAIFEANKQEVKQ
jgi:hypothetical protein